MNTYTYDPYGVMTPGMANSVANPWQYTGGYYDAATGYVKLGQRYYNPLQGRWTQLDPLGDGYVYAGNNPVNFTDPTGLVNQALDTVANFTILVGTTFVATGQVAKEVGDLVPPNKGGNLIKGIGYGLRITGYAAGAAGTALKAYAYTQP